MQDAKPPEDVDDSQDNYAVSNAVVIDVPDVPILVILHWPQEQCENLQNQNMEGYNRQHPCQT